MTKKSVLIPVTPFQIITILEELAVVGLCDVSEYKGYEGIRVYELSISDIYEGEHVLSGASRPFNAPPPSIVEALKTAAKKGDPPPPALKPDQFIAMLDEICNVALKTRRNHQDDETYRVTFEDVVQGISRMFAL